MLPLERICHYIDNQTDVKIVFSHESVTQKFDALERKTTELQSCENKNESVKPAEGDNSSKRLKIDAKISELHDSHPNKEDSYGDDQQQDVQNNFNSSNDNVSNNKDNSNTFQNTEQLNENNGKKSIIQMQQSNLYKIIGLDEYMNLVVVQNNIKKLIKGDTLLAILEI